MTEVSVNVAGRPTKYNADMLDRANWYLQNYEELGDVVPMIAGLAIHLGISRDTVYEWADNPVINAKEDSVTSLTFSDIVNGIRRANERALINGGLGGKFNPAITALMLSKHGYTKDSKVEHTGNVAPPPVVIEATYVTMDDASSDED